MSQVSPLCHTTRSCRNSIRCCRGYHPPDPCLHFWMISTSVIRDQVWYLQICDRTISPCLCQTRHTFAIGFGLVGVGPGRVSARIKPLRRWGYLWRNTCAAYPPIERPQRIACRMPNVSIRPATSSANSSIVETVLLMVLSPKPRQSGATRR